jgi:hypothetical protein
MISVKTNTAMRRISPTPGHILLFLWITESEERKELLENCMARISNRKDFELFTAVINQAAERCWEEFQDVYGDETSDIFYKTDGLLYETILKKNMVN